MQGMDLDLSAYDGIALQVEGDGQTYKLNLKTADQENVPEDTFQATFDTVAGLPRFQTNTLTTPTAKAELHGRAGKQWHRGRSQ